MEKLKKCNNNLGTSKKKKSSKNKRELKIESFGWILLNSKLIVVVGTVSTYLAIWGKRVNCDNTIAEIQQKLEGER